MPNSSMRKWRHCTFLFSMRNSLSSLRRYGNQTLRSASGSRHRVFPDSWSYCYLYFRVGAHWCCEYARFRDYARGYGETHVLLSSRITFIWTCHGLWLYTGFSSGCLKVTKESLSAQQLVFSRPTSYIVPVTLLPLSTFSTLNGQCFQVVSFIARTYVPGCQRARLRLTAPVRYRGIRLGSYQDQRRSPSARVPAVKLHTRLGVFGVSVDSSNNKLVGQRLPRHFCAASTVVDKRDLTSPQRYLVR